jgi:hypothetical protein
MLAGMIQITETMLNKKELTTDRVRGVASFQVGHGAKKP